MFHSTEHFESLNPFVKQIPTKSLRQQHNDEFIKKLINSDFVKLKESSDGEKSLTVSYKKIVCIARKHS